MVFRCWKNCCCCLHHKKLSWNSGKFRPIRSVFRSARCISTATIWKVWILPTERISVSLIVCMTSYSWPGQFISRCSLA